MTTVKDVLIKARAVIAEPEHWCKGWYSKDQTGDEVTNIADPRAYMFCSLGAIKKVLSEEVVYGGGYLNLQDEVVTALATCENPDAKDLPEETVINFNDTKEHADVIAAFDCAIKSLEG